MSLILTVLTVIAGVAQDRPVAEPPGVRQWTPRWTQQVEPGATVEVTLHYQINTAARFVALGDGRGDLEIRVYDAAGLEVAADVGPGDTRAASWKPKASQLFRIVIRNNNNRANPVHFAHNAGSGC